MSYRDRLRAGGQGALQRAIHAGFVPKAMKQEWSTTGPAQGGLHPQPGNNFWSGGHVNDGWSQGQLQSQYDPMVHNQMVEGRYSDPQMDLQQMMQMSEQQLGQQMQQSRFVPQMSSDQNDMQQHMQMLQMPQRDQPPHMFQMQVPMSQGDQSPTMFQMKGDQSPQMLQMQVPVSQGDQSPNMYQMQAPAHMQSPHMQMAEMGMPQLLAAMPTAIGDGAPADIDRSAAEFQGDKDFMALQLRAAAECQQCYED